MLTLRVAVERERPTLPFDTHAYLIICRLNCSRESHYSDDGIYLAVTKQLELSK